MFRLDLVESSTSVNCLVEIYDENENCILVTPLLIHFLISLNKTRQFPLVEESISGVISKNLLKLSVTKLSQNHLKRVNLAWRIDYWPVQEFI